MPRMQPMPTPMALPWTHVERSHTSGESQLSSRSNHQEAEAVGEDLRDRKPLL